MSPCEMTRNDCADDCAGVVRGNPRAVQNPRSDPVRGTDCAETPAQSQNRRSERFDDCAETPPPTGVCGGSARALPEEGHAGRLSTIEATTDPTAEACRRLFELMDRQPANQRQTTQDPHARMMAAYVAMFGQPHEELDA